MLFHLVNYVKNWWRKVDLQNSSTKRKFSCQSCVDRLINYPQIFGIINTKNYFTPVQPNVMLNKTFLPDSVSLTSKVSSWKPIEEKKDAKKVNSFLLNQFQFHHPSWKSINAVIELPSFRIRSMLYRMRKSSFKYHKPILILSNFLECHRKSGPVLSRQ